MPNGWAGIATGAALIFFAYIGFDAISTTAEESRNPQRDMPIGMIASLSICTVLYVLITAVLTGIVPYQQLGTAEPLATALNAVDLNSAAGFISFGAVVVVAHDGLCCWCFSSASRAFSSSCRVTDCCRAFSLRFIHIFSHTARHLRKNDSYRRFRGGVCRFRGRDRSRRAHQLKVVRFHPRGYRGNCILRPGTKPPTAVSMPMGSMDPAARRGFLCLSHGAIALAHMGSLINKLFIGLVIYFLYGAKAERSLQQTEIRNVRS